MLLLLLLLLLLSEEYEKSNKTSCGSETRIENNTEKKKEGHQVVQSKLSRRAMIISKRQHQK